MNWETRLEHLQPHLATKDFTHPPSKSLASLRDRPKNFETVFYVTLEDTEVMGMSYRGVLFGFGHDAEQVPKKLPRDHKDD